MTPAPARSMAHAPGLQPTYRVKAGVLLTRSPQITRELTAFEKAFFLYQRRLNERLALPFRRYFYFQKGTPNDLDWKQKIKERRAAARDIGVYNAYGDEGWNDELLMGAPESEVDHQVDALIRDAETSGAGLEESTDAKKEKVPRPMPRVTEADRTGDERSLDRRLDRSLYLLVQEEQGPWRLPTSELLRREGLHHAAERIVVQAGGINMNTWVVGNAPVGHFDYKFATPQRVTTKPGFEMLGEKTFFMKAKIMGGQVRLQGNQLGLLDFKWLCKEEVRALVKPGYWLNIRNMLAER
ncbi:MAG: 39S ribosomal protein L46, mitochondrial [Phylliscum demangeonii]|nr:MAG: 39S ribosomal protein L46, mitochondrial [Phylliscum demangeonii]